MAQSLIRTLVITERPSLARPQSLIWPAAEPSEVADYYLDVTQPLADVSDSINSVVVDLKPSGPISSIHRQLNAIKLPCAVDGWYGGETAHAISVFQGIRHLPVTGVDDAATQSQLEVS